MGISCSGDSSSFSASLGRSGSSRYSSTFAIKPFGPKTAASSFSMFAVLLNCISCSRAFGSVAKKRTSLMRPLDTETKT